MLLTELADAREHLDSLISEMSKSGATDESDYAVQLGQVFAHLNRAWNSRSMEGEIADDDWKRYSQFPADLQPVG